MAAMLENRYQVMLANLLLPQKVHWWRLTTAQECKCFCHSQVLRNTRGLATPTDLRYLLQLVEDVATTKVHATPMRLHWFVLC